MASTNVGIDATPQPPAVPTPAGFYRQVNSQRFTMELEFVSSLASPAYLTHLHSQGYLRSASFIRYLAYLHRTWSQPAYIKYVRYPNAVLLCKALVENPDFREIVGQDGWEGEATKQIIRQWAGSQTTTTAGPSVAPEHAPEQSESAAADMANNTPQGNTDKRADDDARAANSVKIEGH